MIKCVVWDLDQTLWEGTLAEDGDVVLPEEKLAFLKRMDEAGILQSIATRNEKQAAEQKLRELGIAEYFLFPQIGFQSKALGIRNIAQALDIGLDSIAFLDDSDFELAEVAYFLPMVRVFHAGRQWDEFREELTGSQMGGNVQPATYESRSRRKFYLADAERKRQEQAFAGSREAFLRECGIRLTVRQAGEADLPRICELAGRTSQFRTFSRKVDAPLCRAYLDGGLFAAELSDRFGDYGVVGVCFARREEAEPFRQSGSSGNAAATIEQFCVSCRVGGRGVAGVFLNCVLAMLDQEKPGLRVRCRFRRTDRNLPMLVLLKSQGFESAGWDSEGSCVYERRKPAPVPNGGWLTVRIEGGMSARRARA
ncbi:MAG: HAD-IIIC family phosphatase [Clostridium sp.]|jgi:methoxymalonate biosynthesis protein|nr:HAD-IIIC family phosphatase [Clostridium sp.]